MQKMQNNLNNFFLADTALDKLNLDLTKEFCKKYIPMHECQSVYTARNKIVPAMYNETMQEIRTEIGDKQICFMLDETTDLRGRRVFVFIVMILENRKRFVINFTVRDRKTAEDVLSVFEERMQLIYPMSPVSPTHPEAYSEFVFSSIFIGNFAKNFQFFNCFFYRNPNRESNGNS